MQRATEDRKGAVWFSESAGERRTLNLGRQLGPHTLQGKAPPYVHLDLRPTVDWAHGSFRTLADADGNYEIDGLPAGR